MSRRAWLIIAGGACAWGILVWFTLGPTIRELIAPEPRGPIALRQKEAADHGYLGAHLSSDPAAPLVIGKILKGSGADLAGLKPGDVLMAVGATQQPTYPIVRKMIEASSPGDIWDLTIKRGQEETQMKVKLISLDERVALEEEERRQFQAPAP